MLPSQRTSRLTSDLYFQLSEKSGTALWTCPTGAGALPDYTIEFCPSGTDYVGAKVPGSQYLDATATCSSMATTGLQAFSVPPSPSTTISQGTLNVAATVATGLDGAAAIQFNSVRPSSAGPSVVVQTSSATPPVATSSVAPAASAPDVVISSAMPSSSGPQVVVVWEETTQTYTETMSAEPSIGGLNLLQQDERVRGGQWLMPQKRHTKRSVSSTSVHRVQRLIC